MSTQKCSIAIIGSGVIGCAVACELSKKVNGKIIVIEKNKDILGQNQSSRNSGVIHAGIYYPKDVMPLKAHLCVEGNSMLYDFCQEHNIPHKKTGKLVVANNEMEEEYLDDVFRVAKENGVPGVIKIDSKTAKKYEPNVKAFSALYVPTSGIIIPAELVNALHRLASKKVIFAMGNEVVDIAAKENGFVIKTKSGSNAEAFEAEMLVNAAGLHSDAIARMVNPNSPYEINPIRGESAKFYKKRNELSVNMNVYPVPHGYWPNGKKLDARFEEFQKLFREGKVSKTVGVHLTPAFDGMVTIGPAYAGNIGKEDYEQTVPEKHYFESVRNFFPNLKLEDISLHKAGINANLKGHNDFVIERDAKHPNCINLLGINSPGLTSSLAIAKYVGELITK